MLRDPGTKIRETLQTLAPPTWPETGEQSEPAPTLGRDEQLCMFCGGDPTARCRERSVSSDGAKLVFVGNMTEGDAFALGYRVSGRVRACGGLPVYHAYDDRPACP